MSTINYDLSRLRALVFDVDGVLSATVIPMSSSGEPLRMGLDPADIYLGSSLKEKDYCDFRQRHGLTDAEIAFMGDDIPDLPVLRLCGLACCPHDAAPEVKQTCRYISYADGGYGCGRDLVEQTLKAQGLWLSDDKAFGW